MPCCGRGYGMSYLDGYGMVGGNAWRKHLMAFYKSHPNMSFSQAMKAAAKTYKKKASKAAPKRKTTKKKRKTTKRKGKGWGGYGVAFRTRNF